MAIFNSYVKLPEGNFGGSEHRTFKSILKKKSRKKYNYVTSKTWGTDQQKDSSWFISSMTSVFESLAFLVGWLGTFIHMPRPIPLREALSPSDEDDLLDLGRVEGRPNRWRLWGESHELAWGGQKRPINHAGLIFITKVSKEKLMNIAEILQIQED